MTRHGLTLGRVASVFLVVGGLSTIGWMLWERSGRIVPPPTWFAGLMILVLAGLVLVAAWPVRTYLLGRSTRTLDPMKATRVLVLAQAGALTGAALAGWYAGQVAVSLLHLSMTVYRERAWQIALLALVALVLSAAGLWAQSWCRIDPPKEGESGSDQSPE